MLLDAHKVYPPPKVFECVLKGTSLDDQSSGIYIEKYLLTYFCFLYPNIDCLKLLDQMIKDKGMAVCPTTAISTIAAKIGDDKNEAVRKRALDTMVTVHSKFGEDTYNYIKCKV